MEVSDALELTFEGRSVDQDFEILAYLLPLNESQGNWSQARVFIGAGSPYAFLENTFDTHLGGSRERLWLRRPVAQHGQIVEGDVFQAADVHYLAQPGKHYRFHVEAPPAKTDPTLTSRWLSALALDLGAHNGPFFGYARAELNARTERRTVRRRATNPTAGSGELAQLIGTMTGRTSVQEALEQQHALYVDLTSGARRVSIDKLLAPRLTPHPWAAMQAKLSQKPGAEPLALATPADFYFLRSQDFASFLDLADLIDSWAAPALNVLDGRVQEHVLKQRYETELALDHGELARVFGPSVVTDLALVGSDPYLVEGSDLTLIFRVKSATVFEAALLAALNRLSAGHPGLTTQSFQHEGVTVNVTRSADGRVRRHRASVQGFELVSNSAGAIRRVISAIHGKIPRLSEEPDFSYMLARDADQPAPLLAFAGDRFVASVVGPQQKLKEAERELALSELSRPGYAALLYGFLMGHSPANANELVHAKLLEASALKPGGMAANWQPGLVAQSAGGSTLGMEPLIDAPALTVVTAGEQAGYESFARSYESEWSDYIDPFAVRLARSPLAKGGTALSAELRVLPLLRREYRDYTRSVGTAHVQPGELWSGFRALLGIGKEAPIRHLLNGAAHRFMDHPLTFDWLGQYAFLGVADRNGLLRAARYEREISVEMPQSGNDTEERPSDSTRAGWVPAYAGIEIASGTGAAIALSVVKHSAEQAAPDAFDWHEVRKHRGVTIVGVQGKAPDVQDLQLFYALTPHLLLLSLNVAVLETVIDQTLDGTGPAPSKERVLGRDPQLVIDFKAKPQGALETALAWLFTKELKRGEDRGRDAAFAVFQGAPELAGDPEKGAALMRSYFGSAFSSPEGRHYGYGSDGVIDPLCGSSSAPIWPEIPVAGSPVASLLGKLASFRSELSFDDEPSSNPDHPLQSLRVRLELELR